MKGAAFYLLGTLAVIWYSVDVTKACSCSFISLEQHFCSCEWAFSLEVLGQGEHVGTNLVYPINVVKVERSPYRLGRKQYPTRAVTSGDPMDSCALTLLSGYYYILSGELDDMQDGSIQLRIFSCDMIQVFKTSKDLKRFSLPDCVRR